MPPEVVPVDGYRPGEKQPRYDSSFTLRLIDGQPQTMSYGHHLAHSDPFGL